jgi:hypothetical protein
MGVEFDAFRRLGEALSKPYYSVVSSLHGKIFLHEAIETETFEHLCRDIAGGHYEVHPIKAGSPIDRGGPRRFPVVQRRHTDPIARHRLPQTSTGF